MSIHSGASSDSAALMRKHTEAVYLNKLKHQTDCDGRTFFRGAFVTTKAHSRASWHWKLLHSGGSLFSFCLDSMSGRSITLSSVSLWARDCNKAFSSFVSLIEKEDIGQSSYESVDFSVADSLPRLGPVFRHPYGVTISLMIKLTWSEAAASGSAVAMGAQASITMGAVASDHDVLECLYAKAIDGGDAMHELVSSDGQAFSVSIPVLEAKSAYFKRFFAMDGWKEQTEGRTMLAWSSGVVKKLLRYVYLGSIDGDVCELLPDILDAAQMWELIAMKPLIEAQMKQRLQKAARDADTDTAAEYLQLADLHQLTSLVPICNGVLADNFDAFYDSDTCKLMMASSTSAHLVKALFYHKSNTRR